MRVSFTQGILPLFGARNIGCMARCGVLHAHLAGTAMPRMPMGGPDWADARR